MKKILAFILVAVMAFSLVACGTPAKEGNEVEEVASSAVEILNNSLDKICEDLSVVFEAPADDVKGIFVGGYFSEDETTAVSGGAGTTPIDVEDASVMFKMISLVSEDSFAKLDDSAIMYHMMNTNTCAISAMHVADAADVDAVASSLKDSITTNMWSCGFPERYVVIKVGSYIVSAYGLTDYVNAVKAGVTATYGESAVVVYDDIVE